MLPVHISSITPALHLGQVSPTISSSVLTFFDLHLGHSLLSFSCFGLGWSSDSGQAPVPLASSRSEFGLDHGAGYHSSCAKEAFFGLECESVPSPLLWLNQAVVAVLTAV